MIIAGYDTCERGPISQEQRRRKRVGTYHDDTLVYAGTRACSPSGTWDLGLRRRRRCQFPGADKNAYYMKRQKHARRQCISVRPVSCDGQPVRGEYTTRLACPCLVTAEGHASLAAGGGRIPASSHRANKRQDYLRYMLPTMTR